MLAFGIEPKPFRSVKQKHIKPCDSSLKSVKVYRALAQGAPARQVVASQYKWLQAYVQPLQCMTYSGDAFCDISSSRGENCLPFLEIARNEGSVCDYLFECHCRSRPMWQSIAWLALAFSIEPKSLHSVKQKHIKPCDNNLKSQKFTELWTKEYLCVFNMNREMEKKITPQGGGLRIF